MFERYTIGATVDDLKAYFRIDPHAFDGPRYNAAPAQLLPVIIMGSSGLSHFYWGAPPQWASGKSISEKIINVHIEQIEERASIRKRMKKHRCIVPADGFYGWKKIGKKTTVPYRFELKPKGLFGMAGLWEEYEDLPTGQAGDKGETIHTFSVLTEPSSPEVTPVSERMPFILSPETMVKWLDENVESGEILKLTRKQPLLEGYTVSPRVNSIETDNVTLIQPAPPADQFGNLTLFN
jgi:putative SOS response-associated peptidase YedK